MGFLYGLEEMFVKDVWESYNLSKKVTILYCKDDFIPPIAKSLKFSYGFKLGLLY